MSTYGNTGNEGQRGGDDGNNADTYGAQYNEPSRNRGDSGRDDDYSSTHPSQGGRGSNDHDSYHSNGGYGRGQGSGARGNEPSPHNDGDDPNPYGPYVNEPSRHKDIDIFVHPGNRSPVSMKANLDWTLDKLHSSCARRCSMDPGQCHSTCAGVPVSGRRKIHETSIQGGSTVIMSMRLRGG